MYILEDLFLLINLKDSCLLQQQRDPADDWSEHISSSGKKYYYHCRTEVSQWEKPKEWLERWNVWHACLQTLIFCLIWTPNILDPKHCIYTENRSREKVLRLLSTAFPKTEITDKRRCRPVPQVPSVVQVSIEMFRTRFFWVPSSEMRFINKGRLKFTFMTVWVKWF